ncbi:hypothetical protein FRC10_001123 [Ceratobasidium sp. 414]|nr:hypothetical protein FRC10_001123 [Ceratobasidium sp. 414]
MRAWRQLVWQAKPLTDRVWNNLYPKLVPILEANKRERLIREQQQLQAASRTQMLSFLNNIEENEYPYIELAASPDISAALATFGRVRLPFPTVHSIRKLPFLEELWMNGTTPDDTLASLTSWRPKLDQAISGWRRNLERELVEKLSRGEFEVAFDSMMRFRQRLFRKDKHHHHSWEDSKYTPLTHQSNSITPSAANFTPESRQYVGSDTRVLLRADSIFGVSGSDSGYFYPEVMDELERKLAYNPNSRYKHELEYDYYDYDEEAGRIEQLDISLLWVNNQAQEVAEELLSRLERPNATYLEMKAIGQRFVDHYVTGYRTHQARSSFYSCIEPSITSVNLHDLNNQPEAEDSTQAHGDEKPNTREIAKQIPVEIATPEDADTLLSAQPPAQLMGCLLCELVPQQPGEMGEPPKGSKEVMEKHLAEEHRGTPGDKSQHALYPIE